MKNFTAIAILFIAVNSFAQNQGRLHVQQLASERMYGRGYVNNGAEIAAQYIDSCFASYGVKPFEYFEGYHQDVNFIANTFPNEMDLQFDGVKLTAGDDFLIDPISKGGSGNFKCIPFDKNDLQTICNKKDKTSLQAKYKQKYAKTVLIFNETDTSFSAKDVNTINQWISLDLIWSGNYSIGGIVNITNKKLTHSVESACGGVPHFIVNDKKLPSKSPKTAQFNVSQQIDSVSNSNVCGYIEGKDTSLAAIMFTAHYDHLGMMGKNTTFYGANDNASGVAMLLSLAEYFSKNQPKRTIIFVATCGEELGMLGAKQFVNDSPIDLQDIRFLVNLDLEGTGEDGICVVNSSIFATEFSILQTINNEHNYLSIIKERGEACNSDHCPFYKRGIPSFYLYTMGGNPAYHDIHDRAENLSLYKFNNIVNLLTEFAEQL